MDSTLGSDSYEIEGIATVDARGQMVLPKEARSALGLGPGSKLTVIVVRNNNQPCCISLVPVAPLEAAVRNVIHPTSALNGGNNGN